MIELELIVQFSKLGLGYIWEDHVLSSVRNAGNHRVCDLSDTHVELGCSCVVPQAVATYQVLTCVQRRAASSLGSCVTLTTPGPLFCPLS